MTECTELLREARLEIEVLKGELVSLGSKYSRSATALEEALCRVHVLRAVLNKGSSK